MQKSLIRKGIAFIVILLFIGMSIIPSTGRVLEKSISLSSDGITLYVGGSGEGNYTKIQDAIYDASDGDTVFVYNGTYVETVVVNKTINLIGEDKNTTVIDGGGGTDTKLVVLIENATGVNVSEFTIRNGGFNGCGLIIESKYNTITNNIFGPGHKRIGLSVREDYNIVSNNTIINKNAGLSVHSDYNRISDNTMVVSNDVGLWVGGQYNLIKGNIIIQSYIGIEIAKDSNNISHNIISNSRVGIYIWQASNNYVTHNIVSSSNESGIIITLGCEDNNISRNIITENKYDGIHINNADRTSVYGNIISNNRRVGVSFRGSDATITMNNITNNSRGIVANSNKNNFITKNNLMNNKVNARYGYSISEYLFGGNIWDANYWDSPQQEPVPIWGRIGIPFFYFIPWFPQYDKNPAQEPYDI